MDFYDTRREDWVQGWRPTPDQVKEVVKSRESVPFKVILT
jgi:hypothetical protein